MRAWKRYVKRYHLEPTQETTLASHALGFRRNFMKRSSFDAWRWHVRVIKRKHREMNEQAARILYFHLFDYLIILFNNPSLCRITSRPFASQYVSEMAFGIFVTSRRG